MGFVITLLGGAGMMGQGIARDLLGPHGIIEVADLRVCDTDPARLDALAEALGDARMSTHVVDVTDRAAVPGVLDGADLCINSVPTLAGHQMAIFEAALTAGVHYTDLGGLGTYTVKQLEWHDRFAGAGLAAVLGTGADPGLSNVTCRAVADRLDEIDAINLYWAATLEGPENPVLVPPYAVSTVLAEYGHPSIQFLDGRHVECPPRSGIEVIDLPDPFGPTRFMFSAHSEQLTVPLAPGIAEKGIREFTWRLSLPEREHEAWTGLVKAGFGAFDRPVRIGGQDVRPIDVLNAVIARNMAENRDRIPAQEGSEIHFAIGRGRKDGNPVTVRCEAVLTPDPSHADYVDAATSMNASIAAQLLLARPLRPGVHAPESYFEPGDYFREAEKRGFVITVETFPGAA